MLHVTAILQYRTQTDRAPSARVTGVYDSRAEALAIGRPWTHDAVLSVTWAAGTSRRPIVGDTLPTTDEGAGLIAVVMPQNRG
jgi:hypothetical protein